MTSTVFIPQQFQYATGYKATHEEKDFSVLDFTLRSINNGVDTADELQKSLFPSHPNARQGSYVGNTLRNMGLADYIPQTRTYLSTPKGLQYLKSSKATKENLLSAIIYSIDMVASFQQNASKTDVKQEVINRYKVSENSASRSVRLYQAWDDQANSYGLSLDRSVLVLPRYSYTLFMPKVRYGQLCDACFMLKSLSGVCDMCD